MMNIISRLPYTRMHIFIILHHHGAIFIIFLQGTREQSALLVIFTELHNELDYHVKYLLILLLLLKDLRSRNVSLKGTIDRLIIRYLLK